MLRKCTNHFRNMNSEVKLMICVDQNGQAVEISVVCLDAAWLVLQIAFDKKKA